MRSKRIFLLALTFVSIGLYCCNSIDPKELNEFQLCSDSKQLEWMIKDNPKLLNAKAGEAGITKLHLEAFMGRFYLVKILIDAGSDVNIKDNEGKTPLHSACEFEPLAMENKIKIIELLISSGVKINAKDDKGRTALTLAKRQASITGNNTLVDLLVQNGAEE